MKTFLTLLAKDWREQRFALFIVLALGTVLATGAALLVDTWLLESTLLARVMTFAFGALVATAVGCDLGSRERGEGSQSWMLRQPFALPWSVLSKLTVLSGMIAFGLLLGWTLSRGLASTFGAGSKGLLFDRGELFALAAIYGAGLWSAAASSFLPRGFLAAPGALVVLLTCLAPAWVPVVWFEIFPNDVVVTTLILAVLLGGVVAFAAGQLFAVRRWDSQVVRALAVLGFGSLAATPLWASAGAQTLDLSEYELGGEPVALYRPFLSADGNQVFLNIDRHIPGWRGQLLGLHAISLDLETGETRELGTFANYLTAATHDALLDGTADGAQIHHMDGTVVAAVDASGRSIPVGELREDPFDPGFAVPVGWRILGAAGAGWWLEPTSGDMSRRRWTNATGEVAVESKDLQQDGRSLRVIHAWWTTAGLLVQSADSPRPGYFLVEEASGSFAPRPWLPCPSLNEEQIVLGALPDGRLLVREDTTEERPVLVYDLAFGRSEPLRDDAGRTFTSGPISADSRFSSGPFGVQLRVREGERERRLLIESRQGGAPVALLFDGPDRPAPNYYGGFFGPEDSLPTILGKDSEGRWVTSDFAGIWVHPEDGTPPKLLFDTHGGIFVEVPAHEED